jgi:glycosyltransferase involved in cell wall biosynthesis
MFQQMRVVLSHAICTDATMTRVWSSPAMSFVIPAHNDSAVLPRTLLSVIVAARMLGEAYEIIVVDADSTDDTAVVASLHGANVLQISERPVCASRNAGARAARGQYLVFVDSDITVSTAVVFAAWRTMKIGAAGGSATAQVEDCDSTADRIASAVSMIAQRAAKRAAPGFIFCTRDAFDSVGGFDESALDPIQALGRALKNHGRFIIVAPPVISCAPSSESQMRALQARSRVESTATSRSGLRPADADDLGTVDR